MMMTIPNGISGSVRVRVQVLVQVRVPVGVRVRVRVRVSVSYEGSVSVSVSASCFRFRPTCLPSKLRTAEKKAFTLPETRASKLAARPASRKIMCLLKLWRQKRVPK
jgi:hypothetical protein